MKTAMLFVMVLFASFVIAWGTDPIVAYRAVEGPYKSYTQIVVFPKDRNPRGMTALAEQLKKDYAQWRKCKVYVFDDLATAKAHQAIFLDQSKVLTPKQAKHFLAVYSRDETSHWFRYTTGPSGYHVGAKFTELKFPVR